MILFPWLIAVHLQLEADRLVIAQMSMQLPQAPSWPLCNLHGAFAAWQVNSAPMPLQPAASGLWFTLVACSVGASAASVGA